jgi:hypothetical protein
MRIIREYYVDALALGLLWTFGSVLMNTHVHVGGFTDLINVFVLIVFVQFLYQGKQPPLYQRYLVLSYGSLLWLSLLLVFDGPMILVLFGSGYVFSLSVVFLLWSIVKG